MAKEGGANWVALGAFVKQRRFELGLSLKEAADLADVSDEWWRQLEAGQKRLPTGEIVPPNARGHLLGRAARVLQMSLTELTAVLEEG